MAKTASSPYRRSWGRTIPSPRQTDGKEGPTSPIVIIWIWASIAWCLLCNGAPENSLYLCLHCPVCPGCLESNFSLWGYIFPLLTLVLSIPIHWPTGGRRWQKRSQRKLSYLSSTGDSLARVPRKTSGRQAFLLRWILGSYSVVVLFSRCGNLAFSWSRPPWRVSVLLNILISTLNEMAEFLPYF
jgi:hypothetical protein